MCIYRYFQDYKVMRHKPSYRWRLLWFTGIIVVSACYIFDLVAPLQNAFQHKDFHLSTVEYNLFYGIFSVVNIFASLYVGVTMERCGERFAAFILSSFMFIGQVLFTYACFNHNYGLAVLGRLILGVGAENMCMLAKYLGNKWFKNYEISFAYGFNMGLSRFGICLVTFITPILYEAYGLNVPLVLGCLLASGSLIAVFLINHFDRKFTINRTEVEFKLLGDENEDGKKKKKHRVKMIDVFKYGKNFWLFILILYFTFGSFFTFTANSNELLMFLYGYGTEEAGGIIAVAYIFFSILCVGIGPFVDKLTNKMIILRISLVCLLASFIIFAFFDRSFCLYAFVLMTFHFALFQTSFWALFGSSLTKDKEKAGFGCTYCAKGMGLFVVPILLGLIRDATIDVKGGFFWPLIFLSTHTIMAFIGTYFLDLSLIKQTGH